MNTIVKSKIERYKKRKWNHADRFNELTATIHRFYPDFVSVPREGIWMYNDLPAGELSPLISDLTLGQEYMEVCLVLGIDWTKHQRWCPKQYRQFQVGNETLYDIWLRAKSQVNSYFYEYGYIDDEDNNLRPRKPRIGDCVQTVRRSSPGVVVRGDEIIPHWDNSHNVFEEPKEVRVPENDVFLEGRMSQTQEDTIYEYDIIGGKVVQGVWMFQNQARNHGVPEYVIEDAPRTFETKKIRCGGGSIKTKRLTYVFITKKDIQF